MNICMDRKLKNLAAVTFVMDHSNESTDIPFLQPIAGTKKYAIALILYVHCA